MYGLEKNKKNPFEMDLEKELKKDIGKARSLLKETEQKVQEIKGLLRQGSKGSEFDDLGILLNGYLAMETVLKKFINKK